MVVLTMQRKSLVLTFVKQRQIFSTCQFCLGGIYKIFEYEEISFKGTIYDFSVNYNKSRILIIY